jgi:hypothetical protein
MKGKTTTETNSPKGKKGRPKQTKEETKVVTPPKAEKETSPPESQATETTSPDEETTQRTVVLPSGGYKLWEGKLYSPRSNRFFAMDAVVPLKSLDIEAVEPKLSVKCPKISWTDWCQIVSFHRWCVATFRAETHISHLLTRDGQYVHCPFHQQVRRGAMTIQVDYVSPENQEIIRQLGERYGISTGDFHGTTHNHVVSGAFESGTDKSDEEFKQGFHFTVGNMDKPVISIHARVRVIIPAQFDGEGNRLAPAVRELVPDIKDVGQLIEIPGWDPALKPEHRVALSQHWAIRTPKLTRVERGVAEVVVEGQVATPDDGFPEEWKDYITEIPTTSYSTPGKYYGPGHYYGGTTTTTGTTTGGGGVREIIAKVFDYVIEDVKPTTLPRNGADVVDSTTRVDNLDQDLEEPHSIWSDHPQYDFLVSGLAAIREGSLTLTSVKELLRCMDRLQTALDQEEARCSKASDVLPAALLSVSPAPTMLIKRSVLNICRKLESVKDWSSFNIYCAEISSICDILNEFADHVTTLPPSKQFVFTQPLIGENLKIFNEFFTLISTAETVCHTCPPRTH